MHLIDTGTLKLYDAGGDDIPKYAILSHTWGKEEVLFADMEKDIRTQKLGWQKIERSAAIAKSMSLKYIWVDTCCIDRSSSAELSEAINSMYRWYKRARMCIAYLADVKSTSGPEMRAELATSRWFKRGWTLQELLAPRSVNFYNMAWEGIGSKSYGRKYSPFEVILTSEISDATGIPTDIISDGRKVSKSSVAQRMSWASERETSRIEDQAYSLMGLFGIYMPVVYGEGSRAFVRLQEEILKTFDDETSFAWHAREANWGTANLAGVLARSPRDFAKCNSMITTDTVERSVPYLMTNKGLSLQSRLMIVGQPFENDHIFRVLEMACTDTGYPGGSTGILMRPHQGSLNTYSRVFPHIVLLLPSESDRFKWDTKKNLFIKRERNVEELSKDQLKVLDSRIWTGLTFDIRDTSIWFTGLRRLQEWSISIDQAIPVNNSRAVKAIRYLNKDASKSDCILLIEFVKSEGFSCRLFLNEGKDLKSYVTKPPARPSGPPENYLTLSSGDGSEFTLIASIDYSFDELDLSKSAVVDLIVAPGRAAYG